MKTTTTKSPTTLCSLIEQTDNMIAAGLRHLDRHVRGELATRLARVEQHVRCAPMTPAQADGLADLCLELAQIRTALMEGGHAMKSL